VYGVGQGSTDAPSRWGFLCDCILEAYKQNACSSKIYSLMSTLFTNLQIAGFVDDTTLLVIKDLIAPFLIFKLQENSQLWERLLHTTGGKLEISKCCFSLFDWKFDSHGKASLNYSTPYNLHVQNSDTKQIQLIKQISPTESYKYVGVELALDGNMNQQIKSLKEKCQHMTTTFHQTYFNLHDSKLGFTTIYKPMLCYALTTSSISQQTLQAIQKPMISIALSRMGFNKHMPRDIVFASQTKGGIGIMDLYTEQGVLQIKAIITHLWSNSYVANPLKILRHIK
jgi:hypothetical protein